MLQSAHVRKRVGYMYRRAGDQAKCAQRRSNTEAHGATAKVKDHGLFKVLDRFSHLHTQARLCGLSANIHRAATVRRNPCSCYPCRRRRPARVILQSLISCLMGSNHTCMHGVSGYAYKRACALQDGSAGTQGEPTIVDTEVVKVDCSPWTACPPPSVAR